MTFNSAVGTYSHPAGTAPHPHAPNIAGSRAFTYDANGNTLTDGIRTFTYDGENRPSAVNGVAYAYGPDSERVKKTTSTTTTTYFGGDVELSGGLWTKYLGEAKRTCLLGRAGSALPGAPPRPGCTATTCRVSA